MVKGQKYHTLYRTTCTVTGNYYIGVHSTDNLEDGYLGSGLRLKRSVQKHGIENHTKEFLEFFECREKLMQREAEVVNEILLQDSKCMNLKKGGDGNFFFPESRSEAMRKGAFTKWKNQEYAQKISEAVRQENIDNPFRYEKWLKSSRFEGKSHSEDSKKKIGTKNSIAQLGSKNSQFETVWITDGFVSKKQSKHLPLPNGWKKGRAR